MSELESEWTMMMRRVGLLLTTWLLARMTEVLRNIVCAVDTETDVASAGTAAVGNTKAAAAKATLTAGFSCPKSAPGSNVPHSWRPEGAAQFSVRCGPNYAKLGRKEPSGPFLGQGES